MRLLEVEPPNSMISIMSSRKVLRTRTKCRILKKINKLRIDFYDKELNQEKLEQTTQSYLGMLKHCKSEKIKEQIDRIFWD